ncbi:MAG: hypothetical protein CMB48_03475 [Euryarchaeota archaeon]|nr:hypothetical protein [Euryarchaeota archaeon]|tara:strand:- start:966 stop:1841 length:876 start_codon:yes stop_codon:yes gene_type:complete
MGEMSKQPSTWSYKTTKILLISFIFFIIIPIVGFTSESAGLETLANPEKKHMIELGSNESGSVTLYPQNIYTVYVKSDSNGFNKNKILIIDELGNEIKPNSTSIFVSLFSENGETYDGVSSWLLLEEKNIEIQNSAEQKIWLVNESEIIESILENDIFIGSVLSCLTSLCLVPVIIIWFVINRPNPKAMNIKFIREDEENSIHAELNQLQNRIPNSDELYRAIHGNENMKKELKEEIQKEREKDSIPAPFIDRPDGVTIKKEMSIVKESNDFITKTETDEENNERWKEWDG